MKNKMVARRNILMVCYYYPPLVDVGSKRSVAFSKYFQEYGWKPVVLSVKNPDRTYCSIGNDEPPPGVHTEYSYSILNMYKFLGKLNGLCSRILKFVGIELRRNYFYDIFCIPDIFWGWVPLTTIIGLRIIKRYDIDVIYVSCSPFSAALVGICLKLITRKPLIIDFRDVYALEIESIKYVPTRFAFRKKIDSWIEDKILKWADLFIVTTEEMNASYVNSYGHISDKIFTVHNGFESEAPYIKTPALKYSKFTIVYAGNFYSETVGRELFFEALALLQDKGKIDKSNFQFRYYGAGSEYIRAISKDFHVENIVTANPDIPHEKLVAVIKRAHIQLLRIIKPMISTKLFEGIALNIPLLAIIPTGEVEEIIKKYSPSAYVITDQSSDKIADAILDAMDKYEKNEIQDNNVSDFLENFSRENLTLKFMKIINEKIPLTREKVRK